MHVSPLVKYGLCTIILFFIAANVFGLGEGGDFHHPPRRIDAEKQTLINHKCVCEALNRHFCQLKISEAKPVLSDVFFRVECFKGYCFITCPFLMIPFLFRKV